MAKGTSELSSYDMWIDTTTVRFPAKSAKRQVSAVCKKSYTEKKILENLFMGRKVHFCEIKLFL